MGLNYSRSIEIIPIQDLEQPHIYSYLSYYCLYKYKLRIYPDESDDEDEEAQKRDPIKEAILRNKLLELNVIRFKIKSRESRPYISLDQGLKDNAIIISKLGRKFRKIIEITQLGNPNFLIDPIFYDSIVYDFQNQLNNKSYFQHLDLTHGLQSSLTYSSNINGIVIYCNGLVKLSCLKSMVKNKLKIKVELQLEVIGFNSNCIDI